MIKVWCLINNKTYYSLKSDTELCKFGSLEKMKKDDLFIIVIPRLKAILQCCVQLLFITF